MPHFMHTRLATADTTNGEHHLPPFPPTQSIRDSTDDLYLALRPSSAHSPSSSSSSSSSFGSRSDGSSPSRIIDTVKRVTKRRKGSSTATVPKFEGARQRRSYFSSAAKREIIQFGPAVSEFEKIKTETINNRVYK